MNIPFINEVSIGNTVFEDQATVSFITKDGASILN